MAVGFFLGVMVTRHGEPAVVIYNATDKTLQEVKIAAELGKSFNIYGHYIPGVEGWSFTELPPHETRTARMSSHGRMALEVAATTAGGRELPSQKVNLHRKASSLLWFFTDGITPQQYER